MSGRGVSAVPLEAAVHLGAEGRVILAVDAALGGLPPVGPGVLRRIEVIRNGEDAFALIDGEIETAALPETAVDWLQGCSGVAVVAEMDGETMVSCAMASVSP